MFLLLCLFTTISAQQYQDLGIANNFFSLDVYKQIAPVEKSNIIFSPLSAELILALLRLGCEGPTADQLDRTLHLPNNKSLISTEAKSLLTDLQSTNNVIFNIADGVFLQKNFQIKDTFRNIAVNDFNANVRNLDFAQNSQAAGIINQWVEQETNGTIKNLVDPKILNNRTKLVLVNALRLKAKWLIPFNAKDTKKANFYRSGTDEVQVDTLQFVKWLNYSYSDDLKAQLLQLPFEGSEAGLVLVVPKDIDGITALENRLNASIALVQFKSVLVNVSVPKFKFEDTIDLKKVLTNLGLTRIFNPSQADISGISGKPGDLIVDQVVQKAFIDFNEGGVEASASTFEVVNHPLFRQNPQVDFNANRPFLFFISYKGIITFVGRVSNPIY